MTGFIQKKVNVFISSKCGGKYDIARAGLKSLLEESGLCSVYTFEKGTASSRDVISTFMGELEESDLVIVIIDNEDGVTDPVMREVRRARTLRKKCLFFFCDENSKEQSCLQNDLMKQYNEKYEIVHEFCDIPEKAYKAAISDIVRIYRNYCCEKLVGECGCNFDDVKQPISSTEIAMNLIEDKKIYNVNLDEFLETKKYILQQQGLFVPQKDLREECDKENDYAVRDIMKVVLCDSTMDGDIISKYRKWIGNCYSGYSKEIMKYRVNAVKCYFVGDIEVAMQQLKEAYEYAEKYRTVPLWIKRDIAIDMRNLQISMDNEKGQMSTQSEGQKYLDEDGEYVYLPVLDRISSCYYESLINLEIEEKVRPPYVIHYGGINSYITSAVNCFVVAAQIGSITHMLLFRKKIIDFYENECLRYNDHLGILLVIKLLLLDGNEKGISAFWNNLGDLTNTINGKDIYSLYEAIQRICYEPEARKAKLLLWRYFAYYMDEHLVEIMTKEFWGMVNEAIEEKKYIYMLFPSVFTAIKESQFRLHLEDCLLLIYRVFDGQNRRWYSEAMKCVIGLGGFDRLSQEAKYRLLEWAKNIAQDTDVIEMTSTSEVMNTVQSIRLKLGTEASSLDDVVKKCSEDYYDNFYSINVSLNKQDMRWGYIYKFLKEIKKENEEQGKNGVYNIGDINYYTTIENIIINNNIIITNSQLKEILSVISSTLQSERQTYKTKIAACCLLQLIYVQHPKSVNIRKTISDINTSELLFKGEPLFFDDAYSQRLLIIEWSMLKALTEKWSVSEFANVVSIIDSSSCMTKILFLNEVICHFRCNIKNEVITRYYELLWPLLLLLEKSKIIEIEAKVSCVYALFYKNNMNHMVLEKLSMIMDSGTVNSKVAILNVLKDISNDEPEFLSIWQKGRVDNNYLVKMIAMEYNQKGKDI